MTFDKLTGRQYGLLSRMAGGEILVNFDEVEPSWYLERGGNAHAATAKALVKRGHVEYFRHEGGMPGVDFFRISASGRKALSAKLSQEVGK